MQFTVRGPLKLIYCIQHLRDKELRQVCEQGSFVVALFKVSGVVPRS